MHRPPHARFVASVRFLDTDFSCLSLNGQYREIYPNLMLLNHEYIDSALRHAASSDSK